MIAEHWTDPALVAQSAFGLPMAMVAVLSLATGIWVVVRERARRVSLSFLAATVAVAVYLLGFAFTVSSPTEAAALYWAHAAYLGVPFIVPALFHFSMDLLGLWRRRRAWITVAWIVGAVYAGLALGTDVVIAGVQRRSWGFYTELTGWSAPFVAWSVLLVILAVWDYWAAYREAEEVQRARIRWLAIPLVVAAIGFIDYGPSVGLEVRPLGFVFMQAFILAAAWVVARYHLPELTPAFAADQILATMAEPLLVVDRLDRVAVANRAAERLLGWSESEMEGESLAILLGRDTARELLDASGMRDREMELEARTGEPVAVSVSTSELVISGRHVGTVIVARDIRERRNAARRLKRREEHFRALIENARDTITLLDAEGRITYRSPSHAQILGWEPARGVGHPVFEYIHPEDRERFREKFDELVSKPGSSLREEVRVAHKDGGYRILDLRAQNLLAHPAVHGVVVNGRDVTEERQLAEQLQQAQKMEAIGRLAGGIAHDFNNILTAVQGNVALMREDVLDDSSLATGLDEVRQSIRRADRLTSQLLSFSRRQVIQPRPLSINQMLRELLPAFERIVGEAVQVTFEPGADVGEVRADPGQIEQALRDLVAHARDGSVSQLMITTGNVEIEADGSDGSIRPGPYVCVAVADDGDGMDETTRQRIFEPFFTPKQPGPTSGLGLATVYGAARQAGGHVEVESETGRGTRFCVYLPRVESPDPGRRPAALNGRRAGAGEVVLVVEDEAPVRGLMTKVLERKGYRVLSAADGEAALAMAEEHGGEIDLLIADLVMPGVSGREVAERLGVRFPDMATILISGYTADEVVREGIRQGEYDFIPKPFDPATLTSRVAEVLHARQPG